MYIYGLIQKKNKTKKKHTQKINEKHTSIDWFKKQKTEQKKKKQAKKKKRMFIDWCKKQNQTQLTKKNVYLSIDTKTKHKQKTYVYCMIQKPKTKQKNQVKKRTFIGWFKKKTAKNEKQTEKNKQKMYIYRLI